MMLNIRYGLRAIRKRPVYALVVVSTLAVGIGSTSAIFALLDATLLRSLPFQDSPRLVALWETFLPSGYGSVAAANYQDWRAANHVFTDLVAYRATSKSLATDDVPNRLQVIEATPNIFDVLGVPPELGRTFSRDADLPSQRVVVVGHQFWRQQLGSDRNVIGRSLMLDGEPHTIVAVMPRRFQFPIRVLRTDLWIPLRLTAQEWANRSAHSLEILGRLKISTDISAAGAEMRTIAADIARLYPEQQTGRGVRLLLLEEQATGSSRSTLMLLMAIAMVIQMIVCVNVASLVFVRAIGRQRDLAIRASIGASTRQLSAHVVAEPLALTFLGGLAACGVGWAAVQVLASLASNNLIGANQMEFGPRTLLFLTTMTLSAGILFITVPALHLARLAPYDSLKSENRQGGLSPKRRLAQNVFIGVEVAAAFVLSVGALLLVRTLVALNDVNLGFVHEDVVTARLSLPVQDYRSARGAMFYDLLLQSLGRESSIRSAALISRLPVQSWGTRIRFAIGGRPLPARGSEPTAEYRVISPGYFRTMGIPILRGHDFETSYRAERDGPVVLINSALAEQYFVGQEPVGAAMGDPAHWWTIAAVVGNVRQAGVDREPLPELYVYYGEAIGGTAPLEMSVVLSTRAAPGAAASRLRAAVLNLDRRVAVSEVQTMNDVVGEWMSNRQLNALLLGGFACIAIILVCAGLYAATSYCVSSRIREFGIRVALGAPHNGVLAIVLRDAVVVTIAGIALGVLVAVFASELIKAQLYRLTPNDPITFAVVIVMISGVSVLACCVPAVKALRLDPMNALRQE